jgi:hypothetical protein
MCKASGEDGERRLPHWCRFETAAVGKLDMFIGQKNEVSRSEMDVESIVPEWRPVLNRH